jgi:hypothetical protein
VIIPDVNLLVYAYNSDAPRHARARQWWEDAVRGTQPIGVAWVVALGFARIITSRAVMARPMGRQRLCGTCAHGSHNRPSGSFSPGRVISTFSAGSPRPERSRRRSLPMPTSPPWPSRTRPRCTRTTPTSAAFPVCGGPIHSTLEGDVGGGRFGPDCEQAVHVRQPLVERHAQSQPAAAYRSRDCKQTDCGHEHPAEAAGIETRKTGHEQGGGRPGEIKTRRSGCRRRGGTGFGRRDWPAPSAVRYPGR